MTQGTFQTQGRKRNVIVCERDLLMIRRHALSLILWSAT